VWGVGWVTWVVGWPAGWLVCVWAFQCQTLEQIVSHARAHVVYMYWVYIYDNMRLDTCAVQYYIIT